MRKNTRDFDTEQPPKQNKAKTTQSQQHLQLQPLQIQQLHQLPTRLQTSYQTLKQSQQSSSQTVLSSQNNKVLLYLKELYMKQQSIIVKGIKQMSEQSKHIIEDLNNIEGEIDKYQIHIDEWIKKIQELSGNVEKVKSVEGSFRKKAVNLARLKEYLNVERPKRR